MIGAMRTRTRAKRERAFDLAPAAEQPGEAQGTPTIN
jgi:hypothetical protein